MNRVVLPPRGRPDRANTHPWDAFLVGPENALAHAAAGALARGDAGAASPLLVHGPSGVGKSRLLAGLAAEWRLRHPGSVVVETTGEALATACRDALTGARAWSAWRAALRSADLLVVDDLDALASVTAAPDELTYTLDALADAGAVVAIGARRLSHAGGDLVWPARLVSRLTGGLVVAVAAPGPVLRLRYSQAQSAARGVTLKAEALDLLAEASDGFRTIEGRVARLALQRRLNRRVPGGDGMDRDAVAALLAEEGGSTTSPSERSLEAVAQAVARHFGVSLADLRGPARSRRLVVPRHMAMYLARTHAGAGVTALGRYFGDRDAKTVRHALAMGQRHAERDPATTETVVSKLAPPG